MSLRVSSAADAAIATQVAFPSSRDVAGARPKDSPEVRPSGQPEAQVQVQVAVAARGGGAVAEARNDDSPRDHGRHRGHSSDGDHHYLRDLPEVEGLNHGLQISLRLRAAAAYARVAEKFLGAAANGPGDSGPTGGSEGTGGAGGMSGTTGSNGTPGGGATSGTAGGRGTGAGQVSGTNGTGGTTGTAGGTGTTGTGGAAETGNTSGTPTTGTTTPLTFQGQVQTTLGFTDLTALRSSLSSQLASGVTDPILSQSSNQTAQALGSTWLWSNNQARLEPNGNLTFYQSYSTTANGNRSTVTSSATLSSTDQLIDRSVRVYTDLGTNSGVAVSFDNATAATTQQMALTFNFYNVSGQTQTTTVSTNLTTAVDQTKQTLLQYGVDTQTATGIANTLQEALVNVGVMAA